jgi:hypothetical protein
MGIGTRIAYKHRHRPWGQSEGRRKNHAIEEIDQEPEERQEAAKDPGPPSLAFKIHLRKLDLSSFEELPSIR